MAFQGFESKVAFVEIHRPQVLKTREKEMPPKFSNKGNKKMTSQELFKNITRKHDKMGKKVEMPTSGKLNPTIVANTYAHWIEEMMEVQDTFGNWDVDLNMGNPMERDLALRAKNATSDFERKLAMVAIYQYGKITGKLNLGFSHLPSDLAKTIKGHGKCFYESVVA